MKKQRLAVRSGGEIVATPEVEVFESVEEAVDFLGDGVALRMLNAQHSAEVGNDARVKAIEWQKQRDKVVGAAIDRGDFEQAKALRAAKTKEEYEEVLKG